MEGKQIQEVNLAACGNYWMSEREVVGEARHLDDSQISSYSDWVVPATHQKKAYKRRSWLGGRMVNSASGSSRIATQKKNRAAGLWNLCQNDVYYKNSVCM